MHFDFLISIFNQVKLNRESITITGVKHDSVIFQSIKIIHCNIRKEITILKKTEGGNYEVISLVDADIIKTHGWEYGVNFIAIQHYDLILNNVVNDILMLTKKRFKKKDLEDLEFLRDSIIKKRKKAINHINQYHDKRQNSTK